MLCTFTTYIFMLLALLSTTFCIWWNRIICLGCDRYEHRAQLQSFNYFNKRLCVCVHFLCLYSQYRILCFVLSWAYCRPILCLVDWVIHVVCSTVCMWPHRGGHLPGFGPTNWIDKYLEVHNCHSKCKMWHWSCNSCRVYSERQSRQSDFTHGLLTLSMHSFYWFNHEQS